MVTTRQPRSYDICFQLFKFITPVFSTSVPIAAILVFLAFVCGLHADTFGREAYGFRLCIPTEAEAFLPGDEIQLTATIHYAGQVRKQVSWPEPVFFYHVDLYGPLEEPQTPVRIASLLKVPLTPYGIKRTNIIELMGFAGFPVTPGKVIVHSIEIGKLYDLSREGWYVVRLSCRVPKGSGPASDGELVSDPWFFRVVDR